MELSVVYFVVAKFSEIFNQIASNFKREVNKKRIGFFYIKINCKNRKNILYWPDAIDDYYQRVLKLVKEVVVEDVVVDDTAKELWINRFR